MSRRGDTYVLKACAAADPAALKKEGPRLPTVVGVEEDVSEAGRMNARLRSTKGTQ